MKLDEKCIRQMYCGPSADLSRAAADVLALCDEVVRLKSINKEIQNDLLRCQKQLDTASSYAEGCAVETGNLRVGVLVALGIEWSTVCPDDAVILQHVRDLRAAYEQQELRFQYLCTDCQSDQGD